MSDRLPEFIDPVSFADKRAELKGEIDLSRLRRLADTLADDAGSVEVELAFAKEGRLAMIEGRITTNLTVYCQNCLQKMTWPVDVRVRLGIVSSIDEASRLPADCEPLLVASKKIPLKEIVEDELILALPTFPKHSAPCYDANNACSGRAELLKAGQSDLKNPFSILAKLKNTGDN